MTGPLKILLVEDLKTDALLIEKALKQAIPDIARLQRVENLATALRVIGEDDFDVVLLDLFLPDTSEFNGLLSLQNMSPKMPIIMLTSHSDEELALSAVMHGAQDYLFKDDANGQAINRAIRYAIKRKQFEGQLITQANYDPLTGLANRLLFESNLDLALARSKRSGQGLAVFFMDLNRFKAVNDTMGHSAGDHLLQMVGERLKKAVRPSDTVARFGGDEFALLVEDISNIADCEPIAQKITKMINEPFTISGKQVSIGVSIGVAVSLTGENISRQDLMKKADTEMYSVKKAR